eukprot:COSAG04_NODE_216_length_19953_cov_85.343558_11_plen_87_part_00
MCQCQRRCEERSLVRVESDEIRWDSIELESQNKRTRPARVRAQAFISYLGRISPIFSPVSSRVSARFHRLAETVPTSPKPEPRAEK